MHIDWDEREKILRKFFEEAKSKTKGPYDCVVGICEIIKTEKNYSGCPIS